MFSTDPYLGLADEDLARSLSFLVEADGDQANFMNDPTHFRRRQFGREEVEMVCFYPNPNDDSKYNIALTGDAADATIEFFHLLLNHPGPAALLKFFEVYALTCIDRTTGYPDAISIVARQVPMLPTSSINLGSLVTQGPKYVLMIKAANSSAPNFRDSSLMQGSQLPRLLLGTLRAMQSLRDSISPWEIPCVLSCKTTSRLVPSKKPSQ